jgi:hypothetical protein
VNGLLVPSHKSVKRGSKCQTTGRKIHNILF